MKKTIHFFLYINNRKMKDVTFSEERLKIRCDSVIELN